MRSVLLGSVVLGSALFFACSSSDGGASASAGAAGASGSSGSGGGAAGAAGRNAAAGEGGASGSTDITGAAGDAGAGGAFGSSVCHESGDGDIDLVVSGLPKTVAASVTIAGPHDSLESESTTLSDVPAGSYTVSAKRVYDSDPQVRTAYDPQISSPRFCLDDGGNATVEVTYAKIAPSGQLWELTAIHGPTTLFGFESAKLTASGSPTASTTSSLPLGQTMAFDHAGDIWGVRSSGQPGIVRYAPYWLGGVGDALADYEFNLALEACVPATTDGEVSVPPVKAVALDASENIWLSVCDKKVLRIDRPMSSPGSSEEAEDIAPKVTLSGFANQSEDLAFDAAGNLWVTAGGQVLRFDRARLDHDDAGAPDLVLDVTTDDAAPVPLTANFLAFDLAGNLWASDFAGHTVFQIGKTDLAGEGTNTAVAKVHLALDSVSLPRRPAFDDEGSLWVSLAEGSFGKLTAEQLAVSSSASEPTVPSVVISLGSSVHALAFFPAASGLPLPSAQP